MYSLFNLNLEVLIIANMNKKNDDLLINERIKVPELMVIGPNGEQMGTKKLADALTIANFAGLDIVLMNPGNARPVAKIMDYNKFKYEKNKKAKDALKKQKAEGLKRKVVGFEMIGKGIPRHGYPVVADGKEIGFVTTGYAAPTVGKTIGLAMVDIAYADLDSKIEIQIRNKTSEAKVISRKFLDRRNKSK